MKTMIFHKRKESIFKIQNSVKALKKYNYTSSAKAPTFLRMHFEYFTEQNIDIIDFHDKPSRRNRQSITSNAYIFHR